MESTLDQVARVLANRDDSTHSAQCNELFTRSINAIRQYAIEWPNHCQDCDSNGILVTNYDPSPAGVSLAQSYFVEEDYCETCMGKHKCPRCGHNIWRVAEDGTLVQCIVCTFEPGTTPGMPQMSECLCDIFENRKVTDRPSNIRHCDPATGFESAPWNYNPFCFCDLCKYERAAIQSAEKRYIV